MTMMIYIYFDIHTFFRHFTIVKGAAPNSVYSMVDDDEVQQLKFTNHICSARSPYQQIDIYHSDEFGVIDHNTSKYGYYGYSNLL